MKKQYTLLIVTPPIALGLLLTTMILQSVYMQQPLEKPAENTLVITGQLSQFTVDDLAKKI
ncbi:MAG: hypothetical protein QW560_05135 [Candidatus Nitrosocaldus sp.]